MNLQDCIDIIRNCTTLACEYHIKDKCEYGYEVRENRFECAKEQAIRALEKQIPKKPREGKFGLMGCPFCLEKVGQRMTKTLYEDLFQYCPTCGQKISWEEVLNR